MNSTPQTAPQEFQGRLAEGKDWREIVAWVGDLPPMPQVASRAISLVENPDTTANQLTDVLSKDPALAARILKIANSAMFSRQREITTLAQAIMIIGFKAIKGVIVAAALRQMNKSVSKADQMVWENSVFTAMCATNIARKLRKRYFEEVFLLGLLHPLGQLVLLTHAATGPDYKKVLSTIKDRHLDFAAAEQEVFGFAHPLIGALVAKKWNFSPETCQVILHYRDPLDTEKPDSDLEEKAALVQLADIIAHLSGIGNPEGYPDLKAEATKAAQFIGFAPDSIEQMLTDIMQEVKQVYANEGSVYN